MLVIKQSVNALPKLVKPVSEKRFLIIEEVSANILAVKLRLKCFVNIRAVVANMNNVLREKELYVNLYAKNKPEKLVIIKQMDHVMTNNSKFVLKNGVKNIVRRDL
jgi:hypothetical protein